MLCPPGWAGIVVIGDAAVLSRRLHITELRGPATLAYLDPADFRPRPGGSPILPVDPDDRAVRQFLLAADTADLEESGMGEITSPAFTIREHGRVVAAAGYRDWPCRTAHLCVLTGTAARGRGLARAAASAAVTRALGEGKLPQWRARPRASRHVALALGFRELGSQASIRLTCPPTGL